MLQITKTEAQWLQSKGYQYPDPLHNTHSGKSSKYYLTENPKLIKILEEYRQSKTAR